MEQWTIVEQREKPDFLLHSPQGNPVGLEVTELLKESQGKLRSAERRVCGTIEDVVWAAHEKTYEKQMVGYAKLSGPQVSFHEQVWQHELVANENGTHSVAVVNEQIGLGLEVETRKDQFPCMYEWQNFQAGQYALGIEPSTNHVLGAAYAREKQEIIILRHGETREYQSTFRILPDGAALAEAEARIRAINSQPEENYPAPSNNHLPLRQSK